MKSNHSILAQTYPKYLTKIFFILIPFTVMSNIVGCSKKSDNTNEEKIKFDDGNGKTGHKKEVSSQDPQNSNSEFDLKSGANPYASLGCSDNLASICKGGYAADPHHKRVPTQVIFVNTVGGNLSKNAKSDASKIIASLNNTVVKGKHRYLLFNPSSLRVIPPLSTRRILDSTYMTQNYGSHNYLVLILVKDLIKNTNGIAGYSPGIRMDYSRVGAIVVMDYDFIFKHKNGFGVIAHEVLHTIGFTHTTDANGNRDNFFKNGLFTYNNKNLRLIDGSIRYPFKIYIENEPNFAGIRNFGGYNWDTRTLMMYYSTNYPLFTSSSSALNSTYSNILNVYYDSFVRNGK